MADKIQSVKSTVDPNAFVRTTKELGKNGQVVGDYVDSEGNLYAKPLEIPDKVYKNKLEIVQKYSEKL